MAVHHLLQDPILLVLVAASLLAWTIILDRALALWRTGRADAVYQRGMAAPHAPLLQLHAQWCKLRKCDGERLLLAMDCAITAQRHHLERGLAVLGVIGSTAPYAGLLGTVIGIIQAFQAIQAQNNMSPTVVSSGIATALIATAMGLAVAIPAVAAHHLFAAAIARRVAHWEAVVTSWLSAPNAEEVSHESLPLV
ncbi:MAG TPA: MotA/TolQ/ExbB proton channel family protein [Armatimonadota bacterium]